MALNTYVRTWEVYTFNLSYLGKGKGRVSHIWGLPWLQNEFKTSPGHLGLPNRLFNKIKIKFLILTGLKMKVCKKGHPLGVSLEQKQNSCLAHTRSWLTANKASKYDHERKCSRYYGLAYLQDGKYCFSDVRILVLADCLQQGHIINSWSPMTWHREQWLH